MIKPWIFEFVNARGDANASNIYGWHLELWARAEAQGFEGLFLSEHHFHTGNVSPSPNLLLAALATRTRRMRLGVMGQVLPLNEPWRVAEEMAMLDHLSGGRLEIGYSSGSGPMESKAVGIPPDEVKPRYEEALEIVERALVEPSISHHGRFWNFDDLKVVPRVMQRPTPPRWITVLSESSAASAARRGCKICTGFLTVDKVAALFDAYRSAAREAGHPADPEQLGLRRQVLIADSDEEAQALGQAAVEAMQARLQEHVASGAGLAHERAPPQGAGAMASAALDAPVKAGASMFYGPDESIVGSPASVAEQIVEQCRTTGAGHFLAYTFGSLALEHIERSYRLWEAVLPVLAKADIPSGAES